MKQLNPFLNSSIRRRRRSEGFHRILGTLESFQQLGRTGNVGFFPRSAAEATAAPGVPRCGFSWSVGDAAGGCCSRVASPVT